MADKKISQLTAASTPLAGTEELPIVQSSTTVKVSAANVTAGRQVSAAGITVTGATVQANGVYLPTADEVAFSTNGAERLRLDNNGNVGVGTNDPQFRLDVNGNLRAVGAATLSDTLAVAGAATLSSTLAVTSTASAAKFIPTGGTAAGNGVYLPTTNALAVSTNSVERVRVNASGEVGVGVTVPRGNLDVGTTSTASTTTSLHIGYSGGNFYGYRFTNTNTAGSFGAGDMFLERGTTSAWVTDLNIDDNGNVSIGGGALATTATNRFLYVPTCAGTPTGVPTTKTGFAPIVVNTTNNKLYFYSGGAWRDAGP